MTENLTAAVESLLFVSEAPVTASDMAAALEATEAEVEAALHRLGARLQPESGLQLVRLAGGYQMCTRREFAEPIARFLQQPQRRLSRSALEVLAVVAYRQPVTASEIQQVRGVLSDHSIRTLVDRGLIHGKDRKPTPGRPILYGTTQQFLHQFNLNDLSELPSLNGAPAPEEVG
ncbi:MAG: SMC-Scp complex subunit ScpB [Armatimonadetes bacterium]|nr:SMC-Scp complex subunit ScpB [Armatimonadota bacterium]